MNTIATTSTVTRPPKPSKSRSNGNRQGNHRRQRQALSSSWRPDTPTRLPPTSTP